MVDISKRLEQIKDMVDAGKYFCINRARQYGKTTTLAALRKYLSPQYEVASISFQGIGGAGFGSEESFLQEFCRLIKRVSRAGLNIPGRTLDAFSEIIERREHRAKLGELFDVIIEWCGESAKPVVLIIDEVDTASNYQVFIDFLAQLRDGYLSREDLGTPVFLSVILAGVKDIKHLKAKTRPNEGHKTNGPWNIAADFNIDMSLSESGIQGMLDEYEADHKTGMVTADIAREIYSCTEGYPYLVSRICQTIDTQIVGEHFSSPADAWTIAGVSEAVRMLLIDKNTLFDSLMDKVYQNPGLSSVLHRILFGGERISYNPDIISVMDGEMYGFLRNRDGALGITNRIFETRLYNCFLSINGVG